MIALILTAWTVPVGAAENPTRLKVGHPAYCLAVSPDGKVIAVGGPDGKVSRDLFESLAQHGKVSLLDAETGKVRQTITTDGPVLAIAFSPDGKRLVAGTLVREPLVPEGKKGTVFPGVWDAETGKEVLELDGHRDMVKGAAYLPGGKRLVTASRDRTARVWDAASG
jgi:WD40 repeat protein